MCCQLNVLPAECAVHGDCFLALYDEFWVRLQALSNTLWAMSKFGFKNAALLDAMATCAAQRMSAFNAQNMANTVRNARISNAHANSRIGDMSGQNAQSSIMS